VRRKITLFVLMFACLLLCMGQEGCETGPQDPTETELSVGENLDIHRMNGEVVNLGTSYYRGDQEHTKDLVGKPYYWANLNYVDHHNVNINEVFKGIPAEVFDSLKPHMKLPGSSNLFLSRLTDMKGEIVYIYVDLGFNPGDDTIIFVIENLEGIPRKYGVDLTTFSKVQKYISLYEAGLPIKLPLDIDPNEI